MKQTTGDPLNITSTNASEKKSMIEIDGSEKIMMNRNGSLIQFKDDDKLLKPSTIFNMVNLEIDYVLMELHEALLDSNDWLIDAHKQKLKKLIARRNHVKHLL